MAEARKNRPVKFEMNLSGQTYQWYVQATLPHGEHVIVSSFASKVDAAEWIPSRSASWVKKYRGGRYA